jgi:hypothetical protein
MGSGMDTAMYGPESRLFKGKYALYGQLRRLQKFNCCQPWAELV